MSKRTALITTRRRDLRVPPVKSKLGHCSLCLEPVWISLSSPKADEIFCRQCAADMVEPGDEVAGMTKRQIADIKQALFDD